MAELVSRAQITPAEFYAIAQRLGRPVARYRKTARVAARPAEEGVRIETRWNGVETVNEAAPGDMVVTALDADDAPLRDGDGCLNRFILRRARFAESYAPTPQWTEHGRIHRPRREIEALALPGGFDILGPWGERQTAERGFLISDGEDVWGNHADTFSATYQRLD